MRRCGQARSRKRSPAKDQQPLQLAASSRRRLGNLPSGQRAEMCDGRSRQRFGKRWSPGHSVKNRMKLPSSWPSAAETWAPMSPPAWRQRGQALGRELCSPRPDKRKWSKTWQSSGMASARCRRRHFGESSQICRRPQVWSLSPRSMASASRLARTPTLSSRSQWLGHTHPSNAPLRPPCDSIGQSNIGFARRRNAQNKRLSHKRTTSAWPQDNAFANHPGHCCAASETLA